MKIGIFAPSAACAPVHYDKARAQALELGYQISEPHSSTANYAVNKYLFSSDSAENRIQALRSLLSEDDTSLIFAARGGYGSHEMMPLLNHFKDTIRLKSPIYLSGLSDATNLLITLDAIPNLRPIHGPSFLSAFSQYQEEPKRKLSTQSLLEIVGGRWQGYQNLSLINLINPKSTTRTIEGRLLGGNLSVLAALVGTPYMPSFDGRILFLEETGEKPYRVHRALSQLKFSGLLNNLAGVLLGDFDNCVHPQGLGPTIDDVFKDIFMESTFPVYRGFPAGHGILNLPLPFYLPIRINNECIIPIS